MNEADFQAQFRPDSTLAAVLAKARVPDRAEQEEQLAAKAAEVARAARAEELALANAMAGNPLAELSRAETAAGVARDAVRDLEARLSEAREVLSRTEGNVAAWRGQVGELQAGVASRSSVEGDLLSPAKQAHAEYVAASRAAFAALEAGTPRRAPRPPSVFRGQDVVRSEHCVWCTEFGGDDGQFVRLHIDADVPVTSPGSISDAERERQVQAEREWQAVHAERRAYSYAGEISR